MYSRPSNVFVACLLLLFGLCFFAPILLLSIDLNKGKKLSEAFNAAILPYQLLGGLLRPNLHYVIIFTITRIALATIHDVPEIIPGVVRGPSQIMAIYSAVLFITFAIDLAIIKRRIQMSNKTFFMVLGICSFILFVLTYHNTYFERDAVRSLYTTIVLIMVTRMRFRFDDKGNSKEKEIFKEKKKNIDDKNQSMPEMVFLDENVQNEEQQYSEYQDDDPIIK